MRLSHYKVAILAAIAQRRGQRNARGVLQLTRGFLNVQHTARGPAAAVKDNTRPSGDGVRRPAVNGVSLCSHIRHTQSGETLAGAIKMAADKVIHIYPRIAAAPRESLVTSQASTAAAPSLPSNTLVTGSSTATCGLRARCGRRGELKVQRRWCAAARR